MFPTTQNISAAVASIWLLFKSVHAESSNFMEVQFEMAGLYL